MFSFSAVATSRSTVIRISVGSRTSPTSTTRSRNTSSGRIERLDGVARVELRASSRARCASWSTRRGSPRTASTCSELRDAARDEQLLGERRRDHRERLSASACARSASSASLDDVRNLRRRAAACALGDIATSSSSRPSCTIGRRMDGRPAVGIDVFKSTQANVVDVADRVIEAVDARARAAAAAGHRDPRGRQPGREHPLVARASCARPG